MCSCYLVYTPMVCMGSLPQGSHETFLLMSHWTSQWHPTPHISLDTSQKKRWLPLLLNQLEEKDNLNAKLAHNNDLYIVFPTPIFSLAINKAYNRFSSCHLLQNVETRSRHLIYSTWIKCKLHFCLSQIQSYSFYNRI